MSKQAPPAAEQPEKIIYLTMDDPHEQMIAKKWSEKVGKRTVPALPIQRLTPDMVIVPVVRGAERSAVQYEEFDPIRHQKIRKERKPVELIGEVMECAPVRVGDYWTGERHKIVVDDFTELMGGTLDEPAFLDALARSSGVHEVWPRTHHGTDNKRLVLTWGA